MPASANYYFQQADTSRQIPFNTEEEKEPVKSPVVDTSLEKKGNHSKSEHLKRKTQENINATQKKAPEPSIPVLPDTIKLPSSAITQKPGALPPGPAVIKEKQIFDNSYSLFTGHLLKPASLEPKILVKTHQYWLSGTIFFSFFLFVLISAFYNKGLGRITAVFTGSRSVSQLYRGEYSLRSRTSILLSFLFILVISLFIFQCLSHQGLLNKIATKDLIAFLIVFSCLFVAYLIKIAIIRLSGHLFKMESLIKEYIFSLFIFNKMLGILLLPVVILFAFITLFPAQYILIAGICLISFALVSRLLWIIYQGINVPSISKYYLFLYLCTLEILPLLVLIKLITRKIL